MDLPPGTLVDRYTVGDRLGEGGMAVVYKVRHNTLGSFHALKVLTLSSPGLPERLVREGRLQASLQHPNIVTVTDVIDVGGDPGLVMEYVEGPTLFALLHARSLTLPELDALARDIIGAVAAAHARGLVHRDLKPANILVREVNGRLVPKITDFGIAKVLFGEAGGPIQTRTGTLMGTPRYMAPEQVRDSKHVGPQADVFSLGAILHEMITGQQAFQGKDLYDIFTAVAEGRRTPLRELVPDVPERMETAVAAALRVDPAARCRDCGQLLALWNGPEASVPGKEPLQTRWSWAPWLDRSAAGPSAPTNAVPDPTPRALAIGIMVGSGTVAVAGLAGLSVVVLFAIGRWLVSEDPARVPPEPVAVVTPIEAPPEEEVVEPAVEPEVPAPVPQSTRPRSAPTPTAATVAPASTSLPASLNPATTSRADDREDALRGYRTDPGATGTIVAVLRTDPSTDVRTVAAEVLRQRIRDGVDRSGGLSAATWGAQHAEPPQARAKCLRALGDHGDARAGAVLAAEADSSDKEVREAALDGCQTWLDRNPGAKSVRAACTAPSKSIVDQLDEGVERLKRLGDD